MDDRVRVLFIAGYGRSGSTLLDRLLGHVDGLASAGEVRHIWREGFGEDRRCGCDAPFSGCPFWTAVAARLGRDPEEVRNLQRRVDRFWRIPQIVAGRPAAYHRDLLAYEDVLLDLYRAIRDVSGAEVVVDSTKDVSHGYLLSRIAGIDLRVVHLVRDSRAVAWSWQRKKYHPGNEGFMDRYSLWRTGAEWDAINALAEGLRGRAAAYLRVSYEDLVDDPSKVLPRILETAGVGGRPLPLVGDAIELQTDHTVAGNPVRFARGRLQIRSDDEWRRSMPASGRRLMTLLTLPALRRYGYPTKVNGADATRRLVAAQGSRRPGS